MSDDIKQLIKNIEAFYNKKFIYSQYIELIVEECRKANLSKEFEDLIFYAKFLYNTNKILSKSSLTSDNYKHLLSEYYKIFEIFQSLLKKISDQFDISSKEQFNKTFLKSGEFNNIFLLIQDFSSIKNYEIDTKIKML